MKIVSLRVLLKKLKNKKKGVVLVSGTFDLLHPGHIEFLEKSKKFGDILVVCLTSNKNVQKRKGLLRPIYAEKVRASIVSALKPVDYVIISRYSAYDKKILDLIRPNIVVFSLEGGRCMYRKNYKEKIEKYSPHLKVRYVNTTSVFSTTKTINKIINRTKDIL